MRGLTYLIAVSMDGFVAAPDGDTAAFAPDPDYLQMLIENWPETLPAPALEALGVSAANRVFDTVIMGWNTYAVGYAAGLIDPYPSLRTVVCTRRHLDENVGDRVELTDVDPVDVVRSLKADPEADSDVWLCGGPRLAAQIIDEIDEVVLKVNAVVLGQGMPLFDVSQPTADRFSLRSSTPVGMGVAVQHFTRAA